MRGTIAIAAAFVGLVAFLEKVPDLLPRPNPAEHWRDELESADWLINMNLKSLEANKIKLERVLKTREVRIEEARLRQEGLGYDREEALNLARERVENDVQDLRSTIEMDKESIHRNCMDYREYARKLADEVTGPPRSPPAACSNLTR